MKPLHYETESGKDIIDFNKEHNLNFNRGCIIKYVTIAQKRSDELKYLRKALGYLEREILFLEHEVELQNQKEL
jgi:hypothetical protein